MYVYIYIFFCGVIFAALLKKFLVKHYHKQLYYLFLKYISTPFSQYEGKYFINNFQNIIKPYFKGNIDKRNVKININKNCKNQYSLLSNDLTKDILDELKKKNPKKDVLNILLKRVMKYIHLDNDTLKAEDFLYIDVLTARGNYFPFFHTDVQWGTFKENHGFQIWVLLEEDSKIKPRGNMFILETDSVKRSNIIKFEKNNIKIQENGSGYLFPTILKTYNSLNDISPEIRYLKAEIGEVFIMNSLLYHCSDPYILNSNRRALNIRILYNSDTDLKIFSPNNNYTKLLLDKHNLINSGDKYILKGDNKKNKYKLL